MLSRAAGLSFLLLAAALPWSIAPISIALVAVGIAAGPLIYQSGDYFGRTVNLAARIASYATANQVLVDDQTTLASTDADLAFDEVGHVELKGVAQPVRLSEARRLS